MHAKPQALGSGWQNMPDCSKPTVYSLPPWSCVASSLQTLMVAWALGQQQWESGERRSLLTPGYSSHSAPGLTSRLSQPLLLPPQPGTIRQSLETLKLVMPDQRGHKTAEVRSHHSPSREPGEDSLFPPQLALTCKPDCHPGSCWSL